MPGPRHLVAQARLQTGVEIGRRFGRLPFIEQGHGLLKVAQTGGTIGTGHYVFANLRLKRRCVEASGQFRQQFANLIAIHTASSTSLKQTL
jgi:hypothetical protein